MSGAIRFLSRKPFAAAVTLLLGCLLIGTSSAPTAAQEIAVSPSTANQLKYLEVGMTSGRVTAAPRFSGRNLNTSTQSQDRREQLVIDLNGEAPSVDYELSTKELRITVDLDHGRKLTIRRTPQEGSKVRFLELNQPEEGKISVILGDNPRDKSYTVDSLWHLILSDPDFAQKEIEPLLRLLRPGWPLASEGKQLEEALYKQSDSQRSYDRRSWAALVERLRDPHYADRREADRKLRELGQVVVPYLRNLNIKQLDAEQAYRIRTIVRSYGLEASYDTPDGAANWLAADPEVWYALASRADGNRRAKVRTQLSLILGEPVTLDVEATGETLQKQLAEVRKQIDRLQDK